MAAIPWSLVCAGLLMLLVRLGAGETEACAIWSSAGPAVRRGSSFKVYCTFNCDCDRSMYSEYSRAPHAEFNSSTTYMRVDNIAEDRTFSCLCRCLDLDQCGIDILTGYPPETPRNFQCNHTVLSNETGEVFCSWDRDGKTHLRDTSEIRVTSISENLTVSWPLIKIVIGGADPPIARFPVPNSVRFISVWLKTYNPFGPAVSLTANYTLSDIVVPYAPALGVPRCSSRKCDIKVWPPERTQRLEVQYATETGNWNTYPNSDGPVASDHLLSIGSLEPYRFYRFRGRAKFSTGLWSKWSNVTSSWTQEEAPAEELDVWYARPPFDSKSIRLYWKPMTVAHAAGRITAYVVAVHNSQSAPVLTSNFSANATGAEVAFCAECHVTVSALNSKGTSPPANVTVWRAKASAELDVKVKAREHDVALWWNQSEGAAAHVLEWYPEGLKLQELQWLRLGAENRSAVITGLNASECYEGSLYIFYSDGSMATRTFRLINTSQSVPKVGPSVQQEVDASRVKLTWAELPRAQRGGCITQYTIYLEDGNGHLQQYPLQATKRTFVVEDLPVGAHSLWITAWNSQGESPPSQKVKIIIHAVEKIPMRLLVLCLLLSVAVALLLCLCQIPPVKRRVWLLFQCFIQVVPDPANSKWAKECAQEKGEMMLHAQHRDAVPTVEEEPINNIITDVEELSNHNTEAAASPPAGPSTPRRPLTTYLKSDSHESDGSEQTQTSLNSNTATANYLSARREEEEAAAAQLAEEEEEFAQMMTMMPLLPACSLFSEPMEAQIIGTLSLDKVQIDCSSLFENR
ncbi:interleukin-12 receptor subunit beta-2 [Vanacampus margaritifer]